MNDVQSTPTPKQPAGIRPFRTAVLRGLGVLLPPLLTVLILLWVGSSVNQYVLRPVTFMAREALVWVVKDIRTDLPNPGQAPSVSFGDRVYVRVGDGKYVPMDVVDAVRAQQTAEPVATTALGLYRQYVEARYLRSFYVVPFLLSVFVLLLYLLGKTMAARIGRVAVGFFERGVGRLPFVRSVYAGVKKVSDFMFSERDIEFNRVVAIEYPRKGMWSIGFVTGEGSVDIQSVANEPVLSVFLPCSPMPFTGYAVICRRSECIDLNMTVDQALQYVISCGVVVPSHQLPQAAKSGTIKGPDELPAGEAAPPFGT
jgi:uncharacterized membrane protein